MIVVDQHYLTPGLVLERVRTADDLTMGTSHWRVKLDGKPHIFDCFFRAYNHAMALAGQWTAKDLRSFS